LLEYLCSFPKIRNLRAHLKASQAIQAQRKYPVKAKPTLHINRLPEDSNMDNKEEDDEPL